VIPEMGCEMFPSIRNDIAGGTMFSKDISQKEHGHFSRINVQKHGDEQCHLHEAIDNDEDHVMAIGQG
jgi:hypothetical protein